MKGCCICSVHDVLLNMLVSRWIRSNYMFLSCASSSLIPAKCKHSQKDKEALTIISSVNHLHQYLFVLFLNCLGHGPREYSSTEQRECLLRNFPTSSDGHWYSVNTIVYWPGEFHQNGDGLSRSVIPEASSEIPGPSKTIPHYVYTSPLLIMVK